MTSGRERACRVRAGDELLDERQDALARTRITRSSAWLWLVRRSLSPRSAACMATPRSRKPTSPAHGSWAASASWASAT